ncbi:MAG: type II toxin-antitoxin system RelE/ParE family toxin [Candidatus Magasanikbacteria bacterium]|nr:type II toxin-antitoxin system RelE/ParE family toxin [Candidatus Magasanikbacteria bacterium]
MINIHYTEEFERRYAELPAHIQTKAERRERFFRANPFHPPLHTEKLHPKSREVWSFRVDEDYRILFRFKDAQTVYFLTIGPHHWIYRYHGL